MSKDTLQRAGSGADVDKQIEALHGVETVEVELPTIGRIVHLRVDADEAAEPVLRPAIVVEAAQTGRCRVRVFLTSDDIPLPTGAGVRLDGGGYFALARFGPECGEWRWPERLEEPVFFTAET